MQTTLLYVKAPGHPHAVETHAPCALDPSKIPHEVCANIYTALARLCRPDGATIDTVIVALDGLVSDEFEFFSLARRTRPDVTTFVHAHHEARDLIALAIERGATGELTDQAVSRLQAGNSCFAEPVPGGSPGDASLPQDQQPAIIGQNTEPAGPQASISDQEEFLSGGDSDIEKETPVEAAEDVRSGPVPVPWSNRKNAPTRTRPAPASWAHDTPDQPAAESNANTTDADALSEPLLTQEELAALISDEPNSDPPIEFDQPSDPEAPS